MQRTFRPRTTRKRLRVHGFLVRMRTKAGRVIRARRAKGRQRLAQLGN